MYAIILRRHIKTLGSGPPQFRDARRGTTFTKYIKSVLSYGSSEEGALENFNTGFSEKTTLNNR